MDDELITYTEAAALVGVARDTVKQWKSRHDLDPAGWARPVHSTSPQGPRTSPHPIAEETPATRCGELISDGGSVGEGPGCCSTNVEGEQCGI